MHGPAASVKCDDRLPCTAVKFISSPGGVLITAPTGRRQSTVYVRPVLYIYSLRMLNLLSFRNRHFSATLAFYVKFIYLSIFYNLDPLYVLCFAVAQSKCDS